MPGEALLLKDRDSVVCWTLSDASHDVVALTQESRHIEVVLLEVR
jgi:hypothetical protein